MVTTEEKSISTLLQLSAFTQYFFPLGNYIFPVLVWSLKKKDSAFVDYNGKQAINFQLSLLVYSLLLLVISIPVILYKFLNNISFTSINDCEWVINEFTAGKITSMALTAIVTAIILATMKITEFFIIIYAAVKNSNGEQYNYPLTIKFIK